MGTVLLTGIGRPGQVGESVAQAFARRGDRLLLVGRHEGEVAARASELGGQGHLATPLACDLTDPMALDRLERAVERETGGALDWVVMMAGGFALTPSVGASAASDFEHQLSINFWTAYHTTRTFLPMVRARRGSLVYFASEAVLPGARAAGVSAYAIAKGAVVGLMRSVAQEERAAGVRANAIAPGSIRTAANVEAMGPGGAFVDRDAVARVVAFLCSDDGASITGEVIHLAPEGRM